MSTVIAPLNVTPLIFLETHSNIHGALKKNKKTKKKSTLIVPLGVGVGVGGFGGYFPAAPHKYMLLETHNELLSIKSGAVLVLDGHLED